MMMRTVRTKRALYEDIKGPMRGEVNNILSVRRALKYMPVNDSKQTGQGGDDDSQWHF
jgi:hypothetical protein